MLHPDSVCVFSLTQTSKMQSFAFARSVEHTFECVCVCVMGRPENERVCRYEL